MPAFIIVPYLSIGLLNAVAALLYAGGRPIRNAERTIDRVVGLAHLHRRAQGILPKTRWLLVRILTAPIAVIAWPASVYFIFLLGRKNTYRDRTTAAMLAPLHLFFAIASCGFALLLLTLRLLSGPHWSIDLGCVMLLVSLLATLVTVVISGQDLPTDIRRNLMPPYLQFVLMAALYYLTLFVCATLVEAIQGDMQWSRQVFLHQVETLAAFTHVFEALGRVPRDPIAILLTLTGVAYFAMVGKLLFQYRQFKRLPQDHASIITALITRGEFSAARDRLDKLDPQVRSDSAILPPKFALLVAEDRYAEAYQLADNLYGLKNDGNTLVYRTRTTDDILWNLLAAARRVALERRRYRELLRFVHDRGISDGCLALYVPSMLDDFEFRSVSELADLDIDEEHYPITTWVLTWYLTDNYSDEEQEAYDRIESMQVESPTGRAIRLLYITMIRLYHEDTPADTMRLLLAEIHAVPEPPSWFRVELSMALDFIQLRSTALHKDLDEEFLQCQRALMEGANAEEVANVEAAKAAGRQLAGRR